MNKKYSEKNAMNIKSSESNPMNEKSSETKIVIDGKDYLLADLSDIARQQLGSMKATEAEIARLEALLAMLKTARIAYAKAAKEELGI